MKILKYFVNAVKHATQKVKTTVRKATGQLLGRREIVRAKLAENSGQFVMDNAVVFVIILVIAGIVIALLTTFLRTDLAPLLTQKIRDFFS